MSGYYDTMQVCKKFGHKITDMHDLYPNHRQNFCEKCGSETIFECQYCKARIRGYYHVEGVIGGRGPEVPLNCHQCGKSYPWKRIVSIKKFFIMCIYPIKYIIDAIISIFKK